MNFKRIIKIIIGLVLLFLILGYAGELVTLQYNDYYNMTIEEIMLERYGEERPYIKSENYFFVLFESIKYDIFCITENNRNIKINTSRNIRNGTIKFTLIESKYGISDTIINIESDYVFEIQYSGNFENVIIYDETGYWESISQDESIYFFKAVKNMNQDYTVYIDFGNGNIEEIAGKDIINGFN